MDFSSLHFVMKHVEVCNSAGRTIGKGQNQIEPFHQDNLLNCNSKKVYGTNETVAVDSLIIENKRKPKVNEQKIPDNALKMK